MGLVDCLVRREFAMSYLEFQVTLAIQLSLQVYTEKSYVAWATKWLDGTDRSREAAKVAYTTAADYSSGAAYAADAKAADAKAAADAHVAYTAARAASYAAQAAAAMAAVDADAAHSVEFSLSLGAKLEDRVKFL